MFVCVFVCVCACVRVCACVCVCVRALATVALTATAVFSWPTFLAAITLQGKSPSIPSQREKMYGPIDALRGQSLGVECCGAVASVLSGLRDVGGVIDSSAFSE